MRSAERHSKAEYQAWRRFRLERLQMWVVTTIVVQSLGCVQLFVTSWTAARQASLSFTISQSLLKLMSIGLMMPSNHLILCRHLLLLPSIFPSIRYFTNDTFQLWYCRRLLRVPWTVEKSNQSILKKISPEYSLEGLMPKLKLQYFGHLMQRTDSLEKTLMLGKIEGRRRRG